MRPSSQRYFRLFAGLTRFLFSTALFAQELWSGPATWPNNQVTAAGEDVVIPAGKRVLPDVSPPPLGSIQLEGDLIFDRKYLELTDLSPGIYDLSVATGGHSETINVHLP